MSVTRQEWASKLSSVAHDPVAFIPPTRAPSRGRSTGGWDADCSSFSDARAWLVYSANAALTCGCRLAAPAGFSYFASKGARARHAALPETCLAAGVGFAIGTGVSVGGMAVNLGQ